MSKSQAFYDTDKHTLISDETRVYKGGSWADRAFWLSPGARRFLDEQKAASLHRHFCKGHFLFRN